MSASSEQAGSPRPAERKLLISPYLLSVAPPSQVVALLPNSQAARSLGVTVRSLEELANRTIEDAGLRVARVLEAHRLLVRAASASGTSDASGLARAVESSLSQLLRAGVDFLELERSQNERIRRLSAIGIEYGRLLDERGLVDRAQVLWSASRLEPRTVPLCLSGYPRLPAAERAFLDAVAAPGSSVYLPLASDDIFSENREAVAEFESRGWQVEEAGLAATPGARLAQLWLAGEATPVLAGDSKGSTASDQSRGRPRLTAATTAREGPSVAPPGLTTLAYPDTESEVRGTLAAIKVLISEGVSAHRIAVVARNEEAYGPSLLAVAREYQVALRALYRVPLSRTRFGSWLATLLHTIVEDLPFESTARLLAHPLANALDASQWQEVRQARTSGREAWAQVLPLLAREWPTTATRAEYAGLLAELLSRLGVRTNALRWAGEAAAYGVFVEELHGLPGQHRPLTIEQFTAEVQDLVTLLTAPAHPGRGGVELHTPLSMFGASVDFLFVVGAMEGSLPSPVRPDPLLDPFEREELRAAGQQVESVAAAALREENSFWALLHSVRQRLVISYPKLSGRHESLPSPFLSRLRSEPMTPPARSACSTTELRRSLVHSAGDYYDPVLAHARTSLAVESRREGNDPPDAHDGVTGIPYRPPARGLGVSRLIEMSGCPFKFFAKTLLRLAEPEEASEQLEQSLRGSFYHKVLQLAMEQAHGAQHLRQAALEALDESFNLAEEEFALNRLPTWHLERDQHHAVLTRAILSEEFLGEDARTVALEIGFEANWRGIPVRGVIDRMDDEPDGLALVDYKSGAGVTNLAKGLAGKANVDLQLRIYREAAAPKLSPQRAVTRTVYYSVSKARSIAVAEPSEEELKQVAKTALTNWQAGLFPVDPDYQEKVCRYCDFDSLCRKGPRIERKRNRE